MKLTLEQPRYKTKITIEINDGDDLSIHELIDDLFVPALLAIGYHQGSIKEYIKTDII